MSDQALARSIAARAGISAEMPELISTGATSQAWLVRGGARSYVLRVFHSVRRERPSYELEVGLRRRLRKETRLVPEPVATTADIPWPDGEKGRPDWIIDEFVAGTFAERGEIPAEACRDAGGVLALLHALDCTGFGRPVNDRSVIRGTAADPSSGAQTRFQDPWPFCEMPLSAHPVAAVAPALLTSLEAMGGRALEWASRPGTSVCHTDLHSEQLILSNGRLAALIDFGDAMIGAPAWDIGSFLYFHGERQAKELLAGYTGDAALAERLLTEARDFACVIALHHVSRSFTLNRPQRREFAVARLKALLGQ
jgi:aminoglycoside phosphotransferase (APT) family kinase protein